MAMAFGVLGLAPAVLWSMTMKEFEAAVRGRLGPGAGEGAMSRRDMNTLAARFPDRHLASGNRHPEVGSRQPVVGNRDD